MQSGGAQGISSPEKPRKPCPFAPKCAGVAVSVKFAQRGQTLNLVSGKLFEFQHTAAATDLLVVLGTPAA